MKRKTIIYRQGDVLLVPIQTTSRGKSVHENGRIILAHGEATGHAHEIEMAQNGSVVLEQITDQNDSLFGARLLRIEGRTAILKHQEHAPIRIKPGTYKVVRQREYSPTSIRTVAD